MAILLEKFPEKEPKEIKYASLFDGRCWKVNPTEYDYDAEDIKQFIGSLKMYAKKAGIFIRTFQTLDGHVILQRRPTDYIPKVRAPRKNKEDK